MIFLLDCQQKNLLMNFLKQHFCPWKQTEINEPNENNLEKTISDWGNSPFLVEPFFLQECDLENYNMVFVASEISWPSPKYVIGSKSEAFFIVWPGTSVKGSLGE